MLFSPSSRISTRGRTRVRSLGVRRAPSLGHHGWPTADQQVDFLRQIGCHLTAQEFYEKIFLALWFWLVFLMITNSADIIFFSLFLLDFARFWIIRALSNYNAEKLHLTIENATQGFTVGDWFLLYKLRTAFFN